ncbi:unnamed protein product [Mytilus edulis]|uniref:Uncharacterized protein n=1 Tax=Mytilus edulis TaxID=6550 RepID=A0A8S3RIW1_MYTED|nr:unnamed protein product [Mytilus edulis]
MDFLFKDQSIEQIWNIFKSKLNQCIEKYIPKRKHCNKFKNPPMWMDRRTKSALIKNVEHGKNTNIQGQEFHILIMHLVEIIVLTVYMRLRNLMNGRLRALGLPTLEYRRDRYDMLQVYKALHGIDDIKWQNMFELSTNSTRGHPWKLIKKRCNSTQRLHSFPQRIIDQWNSLSTETVCAESVKIKKNRSNDEHWNGKKFNPT